MTTKLFSSTHLSIKPLMKALLMKKPEQKKDSEVELQLYPYFPPINIPEVLMFVQPTDM
jgi:hypothetical protein